MAQTGKQFGVRVTDEQYAIILRRIKKINQDTPETKKLQPGAIARYALEIYLESLTEDDLADEIV